MFKAPTPQTPTPPPPPPNPMMFGSQAVKKKGQAVPAQFDASVLGTLPAGAGTGGKSLLGQ